jgi:hypothetical protein
MDDATTCPSCGEPVSYQVQETRVLTGSCSGCHRVTTLVEGVLPIGSSPERASGSPEGASPSPSEGPECAECGSVLTIAAREDGMLEVSCAECETTTTFVPEGLGKSGPGTGRRERFERPARGAGRDAGPNARPCRQCGAPLTFTTDESGMLTGECASCGNRFTLPPRRDGGFRGEGRGDFGSRGPPRYGRKPPRWTDRGDSGNRSEYRPRSGGYRPRSPGREDPKRRRKYRSDSDDR